MLRRLTIFDVIFILVELYNIIYVIIYIVGKLKNFFSSKKTNVEFNPFFNDHLKSRNETKSNPSVHT